MFADIDECSITTNNVCGPGTCRNIPGDFICDCEEGYRTTAPMQVCMGKDLTQTFVACIIFCWAQILTSARKYLGCVKEGIASTRRVLSSASVHLGTSWLPTRPPVRTSTSVPEAAAYVPTAFAKI